MSGRDIVQRIFEGDRNHRVGFWLGNPTDETKKSFSEYFGIERSEAVAFGEGSESMTESDIVEKSDVDLSIAFDSDLYWCSPTHDPTLWNHPEAKPMFDFYNGATQTSLGQPGVFAQFEKGREIESFDWPNPDYLDFTSLLRTIDYAASKGLAIFSGMWTPFFHDLCAFFGMENYFVKMHTHPGVIEAATEKILDFYLEANRRCLDAIAPKTNVMFFGNDLGGQQNLLISPDMFKKFVLPGFKRIVDQAKTYQLKTVLHSCGSVTDIIPMLIDIGIDGLHPLQARAQGMEAECLAREYKKHLVFIGGVDTQDLLPFGRPDDIIKEVCRLKRIFGEQFIVSPSHEAILSHVPIENVLAMKEAALQ